MSNHYDKIAIARKGLKLLENKEFYFYGSNGNKFKLDDLVFEALEDPNDGYRSSLGAIVVRNDKSIFQRKPLAKVRMEILELNDSYYHVLIDINTNHEWLRIGTGDIDDYYPYFVYDYNPDKNQTEFVKIENGYIPFTERYPELLLKAPEWFNDNLDIEFSEY